MGRPFIAVSAEIQELSTACGNLDYSMVMAVYTDAVYAAGGQPVILPVMAEPPPDPLSRMDGLLLTGGGDLDPAMYGEVPDETVYGVRRDRDAFEAALYWEAVALGLPIMAVCRGMQLINVLRGGTLLQQIEGHWQENLAAEPSHEITVAAGSALAEAMGQTSVVRVNSYHHQCLEKLGTGLHVTAVCGGVIEAVEATDADIVAVQWHPEHMATTDYQQRAIFESFVKRAAATTQTTR